jgi:hypothetical protein
MQYGENSNRTRGENLCLGISDFSSRCEIWPEQEGSGTLPERDDYGRRTRRGKQTKLSV